MEAKKRIWEIDFFRGIAIVLMIIFHLIVDLKDFYTYNIEYLSGFWYYEGKISAILFIIIAGISSTLGRNPVKRGITVFMCGMVITIITYLYNSSIYIRFGILHFLGTAMLLSPLFSKLNYILLSIISVCTLIVGNIFSKMTVESPYLFFIGLVNKNFSSMDYYPLLPWLSIFVLGIIIGKGVYRKGKRLLPFTLSKDPFSYLGKHSLVIYLLHQPVLLAMLYLLNSLGLL
ncbi:MAG: DUF1624 domain-containing protein [Clostridiaceae bacterium]|nr:DUF1624 domain-containing protein [Clostridiaceae bacterium]